MKAGEIGSAGERQLALYIMLQVAPVSLSQVLALPAYYPYTQQGKGRERFRADLEVLRASGHVIDYDESSETYSLNTTRSITVEGSPFDVALLNSILIPKETSGPEFLAQEGLTKILATAPQYQDVVGGIRAVLPMGDAREDSGSARRTDHITTIANAIQTQRRLSMHYTPVNDDVAHHYLVEPWALDIHFGFFYMVALKVNPATNESEGERRFKLVRINDVNMLDTHNSFAVRRDPNTVMPPVLPKVVVSIRPGTCEPLVSQGSVISRIANESLRGRVRSGDITIELYGVNMRDLFDDLMFYGSDAELIYPPEARGEFLALLLQLSQCSNRLGREKGESGLGIIGLGRSGVGSNEN